MHVSEMIVLVMGLPGSGKSYFASRLAEKLGATYINSDSVRNAMQARGRYTPGDKRKVYRQMAARGALAVKQGKPVVADATFYLKALRDLFRTLGEKYRVPVCMIEVLAAEALVKERLSRPRDESEADYRVYRKIRNQFEPRQPDEPGLPLRSGRDNIGEMLARAMDYIDAARC